jgi:hypothetical protein
MPTEKAKREAPENAGARHGTGRADMTSRFVGLIVVPGKHIVKLEVEVKQSEPWEGVMAFRGGRVSQPTATTPSELVVENGQEGKAS